MMNRSSSASTLYLDPIELAEIPNHRQTAQNLAKEPLPNQRHLSKPPEPPLSRSAFAHLPVGGEQERR